MSTKIPYAEDVALLVCGNIGDLHCYLRGCTDEALIERSIEACKRGREMRTKQVMLERHLRKLRKGK